MRATLYARLVVRADSPDLDRRIAELHEFCSLSGWTVSQLSRDELGDRVSNGMGHAKRAGKRLGRPSLEVDGSEILELRAQGKSLRAIAAVVGSSPDFVRLWLRKWYAAPDRTRRKK